MEAQALAHIKDLVSRLESHRGMLTIDADTHVTDSGKYPPRQAPGYYHGRAMCAEELVQEMDLAEVSMANTWQNPAATQYPGDPASNAEALLAANEYVAKCARSYPGRFIPSGWTDPRGCGVDNACRMAEICVRRFGFLMVKMNPAQNRFPIDSPIVLKVADRIVELGAIPVFHYGADTPFTPASGLEALALRYPEHPIVAVHMGGGGAGYVEAEQLYHASIELGLRRPNIKFIFSALRDNYIEEALIQFQMAGDPFRRNLFCASDAPYGRMSWNFGGFRGLFRGLLKPEMHPDPRVRGTPGLFDPDSVRGYMGGNFADLVTAGYANLLRVHQTVTA